MFISSHRVAAYFHNNPLQDEDKKLFILNFIETATWLGSVRVIHRNGRYLFFSFLAPYSVEKNTDLCKWIQHKNWCRRLPGGQHPMPFKLSYWDSRNLLLATQAVLHPEWPQLPSAALRCAVLVLLSSPYLLVHASVVLLSYFRKLLYVLGKGGCDVLFQRPLGTNRTK